MASTKCPTCGQRILNPAGLIACPNCGTSLMPQLTTSAYTSSAQNNLFSQEDLFSQSGNSNPPPAPDMNDDDTTPFPSPASPAKTESQFPKGFPKRPPELAGVVILLDSREEPKRSNGVADTVFNTFLDFIWSIPGGSSSQLNKEKEKVLVTRIRMRTDQNEQRDIRFEGRLTGVNVAQGDRISLWGKQRKGLLAFQRGYNHTTQGPITTSSMASQRSGFLILLIGVVGAFLLLYFHVFSWPW